MNIYITINTIRDIETSFRNAYQLQLESEEVEYTEFEDIGEENDEIKWGIIEGTNQTEKEKLERYYEPVHSEWHELSKKHEFYSEQDFIDFMDYYAFEIFSRAGLKVPSSSFNQLYADLVNLGHKVTVISQEKITTKAGTLVWMGTNKIQANNIKFLDNFSQIWKDCDMLVTDIDMKWPEKPDLMVVDFTEALKKARELEN